MTKMAESKRLLPCILWRVLAPLIFLLVRHAEGFCSAIESQALLDLKGENQSRAFSSWKQGSDCCSGWAGVTCDANQTHVIKLNLTGRLELSSAVFPGSFCNLHKLQDLNVIISSTQEEIDAKFPSCVGNMTDLRYLTFFSESVSFAGSLPAEVCNLAHLTHLDVGILFDSVATGPDCLWKMKHLEYVHLDRLRVSKSFSSQICSLMNLTHLAVGGNANAQIPTCIWRLTKLEYMSLDHFYLPSFISSDLCSLSNLAYLHLEENLLYGDVPKCIWNLTNLEDLHLDAYSRGSLRMSLSSEICNLEKLIYLSLQISFVRGYIPACIWNMTALEVLEVRYIERTWRLPGSFSSRLCSLSKLQSLDISYNDFTGVLPACIWNMTQLSSLDLSGLDLSNMGQPEEVSMPSLQYLGLDSTNINGAFLNAVGNLSTLQELYISQNNLNEESLRAIGNASALQWLYISGNSFTVFPEGLQSLSQLQTLEVGGNLIKAIPEWIGRLPNLTSLFISQNALTSLGLLPLSFPSTSYNLSQLYEIDLSNNRIVGIPPGLLNGSQLNTLDLSVNLLKEISLSSLAGLRLSGLVLSDNPIQNIFGLCHLRDLTGLDLSNMSMSNSDLRTALLCLRNMTQLSSLDLSNNNISGNLSTLISNSFYNSRQLSSLYLSNNKISGSLSISRRVFTELDILDVSRNELTGGLPESLLSSSRFPLQFLNVSGNQLGGRIPELRASSTSGLTLDLSRNNFEGPLPTFSSVDVSNLVLSRNNFTGALPSGLQSSVFLNVLDLSFNNFSGSIPSYLGNFKALRILDLTSNGLEGSLPETLGDCLSLEHLRVGNNSLRGQIPSSIGRIGESLLSMTIPNNGLEGPIPSSLGNCVSLTILDVSHNKLSGTLPETLGNLGRSLRVFSVASNRLGGRFPLWIVSKNFTSLQVLDLSHNSFYGNLPAAFSELSGFINGTNDGNNDTLYGDSVVISAKGQDFTLTYFLRVRTLVDLSSNQFSGDIPKKLGELRALKYLSLSHNNVSGGIPAALSNLQVLESLDLSHNSLTGSIPSGLGGLSQLEYFNVSNNFLVGPIPKGGQFNTFTDASSFSNNTALCGGPLPPCPGPADPPKRVPKLRRQQSSFSQELSSWISREAFLVGFGTSSATMCLTFAVSNRARSLLPVPHRKVKMVYTYRKPYGAYTPVS